MSSQWPPRRPLLRRWAGLPFAAWLAFAGPLAHGQADLDSGPALGAARAWLAGLDAGRYGASWEDAAPLLRESMPKAQWEAGLARARAPMGVVVARKIRQASCTRGTQADPGAEICVVLYDTQFENRPLTDERLTVLKGADGAWRVAAYSLR
jgi:hypothetical protein